MKSLDDSTLEVIAETICGGSSIPAKDFATGQYEVPGKYRTMGEIRAFFGRVGLTPKGESSTRKWFVLEALQRVLNEKPDHDTCAICWQVVRAGVAELLEVEAKTTRGSVA